MSELEAKTAPGSREPKVIKRYTNRKLYDTVESRYVTLDEIAEMIKGGTEVKIIDNRSKEDLTSVTLAQIIFEEEKKQSQMPLALLREIIRHPGESHPGLLPEGGPAAGGLHPRGGGVAPGQAARAGRASCPAHPPPRRPAPRPRRRGRPPPPGPTCSRPPSAPGKTSRSRMDERVRAVVENVVGNICPPPAETSSNSPGTAGGAGEEAGRAGEEEPAELRAGPGRGRDGAWLSPWAASFFCCAIASSLDSTEVSSRSSSSTFALS